MEKWLAACFLQLLDTNGRLPRQEQRSLGVLQALIYEGIYQSEPAGSQHAPVTGIQRRRSWNIVRTITWSDSHGKV